MSEKPGKAYIVERVDQWQDYIECLRVFEDEDDAKEWRDKQAEQFKTVMDDDGTEYLSSRPGYRFWLTVTEVPLNDYSLVEDL